MKILSGIARVLMTALVVALCGPVTAGAALAANNTNTNTVTICHATNSDSNPYQVETPNADGDVSGHAGHTGPVWDPTLKASHTQWGDIIPPFTYQDNNGVTQTFPGLNWDAAGQAIYNNGCSVVSTLTVVKHVDNTGGGTAVASDFTMNVTGTNVSNSSFPGDENGTTVTLTPGTYSADEVASSGYTESKSGDCSGSILAGQNLTCTITNTFVPIIVIPEHSLTVKKVVVGSPANPSDFQMHVTQNGVDINGSPQAGSSNPGNTYTGLLGTYGVSETVTPGSGVDLSDYTATYSASCDNGVVVISTADVTCTVTNTFIGGQGGVTTGDLTVIKHVVGGTKTAADFQIHVEQNGADVTGSPQAGSETGTVYTLPVGDYLVDENADPDYSATFSGDCDTQGDITLTVTGETCTITNTFIGNSGSSGGTSGGSGGTTTSGGTTNSGGSTPVSVQGAAALPATGAESDWPWLVSLFAAAAAYWVSRRRLQTEEA